MKCERRFNKSGKLVVVCKKAKKARKAPRRGPVVRPQPQPNVKRFAG
jgi:hypothetical protein